MERERDNDERVFGRIERLVESERTLHQTESPTDADRARLSEIRVELDQCWDLLRQRRARREFGQDPDEARVRPPEVVESYEQ